MQHFNFCFHFLENSFFHEDNFCLILLFMFNMLQNSNLGTIEWTNSEIGVQHCFLGYFGNNFHRSDPRMRVKRYKLNLI